MSERLIAATAAGLMICAAPAAAQIASQPSLLPPTGTNVQLGSDYQTLQQGLRSATPPPAAPGTPSLLFSPSIGLTEEYTDNAFSTVGKKSSDFITILNPALTVTDDGQQLKATLTYTPSVYVYAKNGNQDRVGENFNGTAFATVVPDLFYIDLRGFAAEQAINGGVGQTGSVTLSKQNTAQDYSFSLSPYLQHRFGSWGTGELGYAVGRTIQDTEGTVSAPLTGILGNQNLTTQNEHLGFTSGENFGRFSNATLLSATQYDGTGVLSSAHRNILTLDNGYAVTRNVILLAKAGYEDIHYSGTTPVNISDAIWSAGVRLVPNADSSITVRYGHQDGLNSLFLDASYAPTARTTLFARYSSGLTTSEEELQNALASSTVDATGDPVDPQTGAPLLLASNFFGIENNLYKQRSFSFTGMLRLDRDVITATVSNQDETLLSAASAANTGIGSNNGTYGTIAWSRDINPRLASNLFVQYGARSFQTAGQTNQRLVAGAASLRYIFTETFFGTLQYTYNKTSGAAANGDTSQNVVSVNLRKTF